MTLRLTRLDMSLPITAEGQGPNQQFLRFINRAFESIERNDNAQAAAIEAIAAAQAAATAANAAAETANNAAEAITAESSLTNSYVTNFTGASPLEADSSGNVTIKNHDRVYGDGSSLAITGGVLATGTAATSIVRVSYVDATRADTTPSFQFTVDPADPPVQGGDTHVIGAVEIPGAGTSDGGYVRPPGYTGATP